MTDLSQVAVGGLVLVRVAAFVSAMPALGHAVVPRLVRVGLVVSLTLSMLPAAGSLPSFISGHWLGWALAITREAITGGLLGFALGLLLQPIKIAAEYLEDQMGLRLGQVADPTSGTATTTLGQLLEGLTLLLFYSLNMHHVVLWGLQRSFWLVKLGGQPTSESYQRVVAHAVLVPEWGMMLALPMGVVLMTVSIYSLLLMRAAAQFQYFTVGLTVRILTGLIALPLLFPEMMWMTSRMFQHFGRLACSVLGA